MFSFDDNRPTRRFEIDSWRFEDGKMSSPLKKGLGGFSHVQASFRSWVSTGQLLFPGVEQ